MPPDEPITEDQINIKFDALVSDIGHFLYDHRAKVVFGAAILLLICVTILVVAALCEHFIEPAFVWASKKFGRKFHSLLLNVITSSAFGFGIFCLYESWGNITEPNHYDGFVFISLALIAQVWMRYLWWWDDHNMTWAKLTRYLITGLRRNRTAGPPDAAATPSDNASI